MRRFIICIIIFAGVVVGADILYGVVARCLHSRARGGYALAQRNTVVNQSEPVLVMGSSRALHHYNSEIMADSLGMGVHNCGLDGNGILSQYAFLAMIMDRYTPRMVVYDVIPAFDAEPWDNTRFLGCLRRWWPHRALDSVFNDISANERFKLISNLYRYNGSILQFINDSRRADTQFQPGGFNPLRWNMSDTVAKPLNQVTEWDPIKYKYFNRMIDLCRSRGTRLVVAYSPWFNGGEAPLYDSITALCQRRNVRVLDFRAEAPFKGNPRLFADDSHLNESGANLYTSRAVSALKPIVKSNTH